MASDAKEISLKKVYFMIWHRLPLIVLFCVIGLVLGCFLAAFSSSSYPVVATVQANALPDIGVYNLQEISYRFNSDAFLNKFVTDKYSLKDLKKNIDISLDEETWLINMSVSEVSDPEYWSGLFEDMLSEMNKILSKEYFDTANRKLGELQENINKAESILKNSEDPSLYVNLLIQHDNLEKALSDLDHPLGFFTSPFIGDEVGRSNLFKICVNIFIFGALGLIFAVCKGLDDDSLLFSDEVESCIGPDNLLLTIPEFKKSEEFDDNYSEYILSHLKNDKNNAVMFSLHSGAGADLIFNSIKGKGNSTINLLTPFLDNSNTLSEINNLDRIIIVLRRGVDTRRDLKMVSSDLRKLGCTEVSYIFNRAYRFDDNALMYLNKKEYKGLDFKF